ncbi:MAG TPA: hypothetical protein PLS49_06455, partial [Candidatus Woesebacteria bacterium]|nr:hypothetical protein [Candidatus Woesebacteria bacterium]
MQKHFYTYCLNVVGNLIIILSFLFITGYINAAYNSCSDGSGACCSHANPVCDCSQHCVGFACTVSCNPCGGGGPPDNSCGGGGGGSTPPTSAPPTPTPTDPPPPTQPQPSPGEPTRPNCPNPDCETEIVGQCADGSPQLRRVCDYGSCGKSPSDPYCAGKGKD